MNIITKTVEYFIYGVELLSLIFIISLIANIFNIEVKLNMLESILGLAICVIIYGLGKIWLLKQELIVKKIKSIKN